MCLPSRRCNRIRARSPRGEMSSGRAGRRSSSSEICEEHRSRPGPQQALERVGLEVEAVGPQSEQPTARQPSDVHADEAPLPHPGLGPEERAVAKPDEHPLPRGPVLVPGPVPTCRSYRTTTTGHGAPRRRRSAPSLRTPRGSQGIVSSTTTRSARRRRACSRIVRTGGPATETNSRSASACAARERASRPRAATSARRRSVASSAGARHDAGRHLALEPEHDHVRVASRRGPARSRDRRPAARTLGRSPPESVSA